jgi:methionine aminotransferase
MILIVMMKQNITVHLSILSLEKDFLYFFIWKMFHTSGWKVSYMLASEDLTALFRSHQQYISYSANAPAQYALAKYLEVFDPSENKAIMQKKRDILMK